LGASLIGAVAPRLLGPSTKRVNCWCSHRFL